MARMSESLSFTLRMSARFARSRALARSSSLVLIVGFFLVAMYMSLSALSLSAEQKAERDLGRFGAQVGFGTIEVPPGDSSFLRGVSGWMRELGHGDALLMLSMVDLEVSTSPVRNVTLLQGDWSKNPYGDKYDLISGRWPKNPGEVVVTEPGDIDAAVGRELPVMSGRVRLQVVGTADDRYAGTSNVLAAQGTWESLDPSLAQDFEAFLAQPYLLWSGKDGKQVVDAFAAELVNAGSDAEETEAVSETLILREDLVSREGRSWVDRSPAGYTVPSLLLPVGAVLLVFGLNDRRFRRELDVLTSLGVSRRAGAWSMCLATLSWCLAAAAAGALIGSGAGYAARMVLKGLHTQALGPVSGLGGVGFRLTAVVVLTAVCSGAFLALRNKVKSERGDRAEKKEKDRAGRRGLLRDLRHVAGAAVGACTLFFTFQVRSVASAAIYSGLLTLLVLLFVPDIVRMSCKFLPERGPRLRLARRQLAADTHRLTAAVTVLTVLTGASLGYLAILDTAVRTADQQSQPDVLPGQMMVTDRSTDVVPPPEKVIREVEKAVPKGTHRLQFGFAMTLDRSSGDLRQRATREGSDGSLLVLDTIEQIEQLIARPLTAEERGVAGDGGILVWADAQEAPDGASTSAPLSVREGDTVVERTRPLPAVSIEVSPAGWRAGTDGLLLTEHAKNLGLPLNRGAMLYSGLTPEQVETARSSVIGAGLSAKTLRTHAAPPPVIPPLALLATAAGLVVLALLAVLTATRAQSRALRGYLGQLLSIGLPLKWLRHILLYQHAVIIGLSLALGALIAAIPVAVVVIRDVDFVLSVPWSQLLVLTASILTAVAVGALWSLRGLGARERSIR